VIKLNTPVASFWTGSADGDPVKVVIDRFKVLRIDTDYNSGMVTFSGTHGYIDGVEFKPHSQDNGALNIVSAVLLRGESFRTFSDSIKAAGAPSGNFRISDIEKEIISQGIVAGIIE
jgi:hypothetical protein